MNKRILFACILVATVFALVCTRYRYVQVVTDKSELTSVRIHSVVRPRNIYELQKIVQEATRPLSIIGAYYSQGGQTAYPDGTAIDMTGLHAIKLDKENKRITVEAGATWREIQEYIDPYNLSIKVMQSYDDFSVGGSLSVNVHARDMRYGSLMSTVESLIMLLADGSLVYTDRTHHEDLFKAALGGYGLLGIIVSATFSLTDNVPLERHVQTLSTDQYPEFFAKLRTNTSVVFQNADVFPMDFTQAISITWSKTEKPVTIQERLQNGSFQYLPKRALEVLVRRVPVVRKMRPLVESVKGLKKTIVWRNYEMSYSIKQLAMHFHVPTTMTLQEYFVPVDKFHEALDVLRSIFNQYGVNILNCSVRYVPQDTESILSYARTDCYAFVLYINVLNTDEGKEYLCRWTRELINQIIQLGGTYYLPYVLCANKEQFQAAYPGYKEFLRIKNAYDKEHVFRNMLWKTYFEGESYEA